MGIYTNGFSPAIVMEWVMYNNQCGTRLCISLGHRRNKERSVNLLRHRMIVLSMLLFCSWPSLAPPLCAGPRSRLTESGCSCPMCRSLGGGAHCACCAAGKCSCHLSSGEDGAPLILATQPAVMVHPEEFRVFLPSARVVPASPGRIDMPDLAIPTPPPKGTPGI